MSMQTAIQIKGPGKAEIVKDTPMPKLRDDYIIVKTAAVALNPTDWKQIDYLPSPGAIVGCDYSGIVEQVGSAVKHGPRVGDRVMGMVHGSNHSNHEDGAFAEHVAAKGDLQIKIPDYMTFEEAATLGAGIITVGQSLYESLELPLPDDPPMRSFPVLIYGGSTATGTLAIQFAKLSEICCNAIGSQGGKYAGLSGLEELPRDDVTNLHVMAYKAFGEAFDFGEEKVPANPKEYDFAVKFMGLAQELLWQGRIRPHPQSVRTGGWNGVLDGLQEMREGKVSGVKLVYPV
ncbi:hypothetical protein TrVGV298_002058 [Trichoderma virens]|nr:hypothetical protein TrVGV298_002058 [Trichoderma virens]